MQIVMGDVTQSADVQGKPFGPAHTLQVIADVDPLDDDETAETVRKMHDVLQLAHDVWYEHSTAKLAALRANAGS